MAGKWQRTLASDPALRAKYASLKGHKLKEEMRQNWCKEQHDEYVSKKLLITSDEQIDFSKGKYMALGRIAWTDSC